MYTIEDLKTIFENSSTEVMLYDSHSFEELYTGPIADIPDTWNNCNMDLYDATYETRQNHSSIDYEIAVIVR